MKKQLIPGTALILIACILTIYLLVSKSLPPEEILQHKAKEEVSRVGVCPPFFLLTEQGDTINPITGKNTDMPYSPKATCGHCHDYEKITQGYHFQQGKDEEPTELQKQRIQWASSPGNYGGSWCSPAPLYAYLSPKKNDNEKLMDMTSYSFVNKCGVCHPGGGPLEFDRNNMRYDEVMANTSSHFTDGGLNDLDGDYYKARWLKSGVIEADCYICHLPDYNNKIRVEQIKKFNYRYAALAASGFGKITGSVSANQSINIEYNTNKFNPDGTVEPFIVKEPRNTSCLFCHAKPGYKKRGADFRSRNDVHLRAGLRCVDCHPAGSMSTDDRIRGKEVHQIAKGDDPGGLVRNDLDNTMRSCTDCHNTGYMGAPVSKHTWLPPLHIDKIACQTCHIPERSVKSVHYVASDIFNPGTKIPTKGKHLWTFYGPDMNYWNHYGDLEMMGYDDKPTFNFSPELVKYKGKIYPANRIHSSWPGIMSAGSEALMEPRMGDIYNMWTAHKKDETKYPQLSTIKDDSGDGVIEINRPDEIDALISSITEMLESISYPMQGKKVVWVMNNRIYQSGTKYEEIPLESYEAAAFGNVHTYNHDIKGSESALGINGCTGCHGYNSSFFTGNILDMPFDENAEVLTKKQYTSFGISGFQAHAGIIRESYVKPLIYTLILLSLSILLYRVLTGFLNRITNKKGVSKIIGTVVGVLFFLSFIMVSFNAELSAYIIPSKLFIDGNHFLIGLVVIVALFACLYNHIKLANENQKKNILKDPVTILSILALIVSGLSGLIMLVGTNWILYNLFDIGLFLSIIMIIIYLFSRSHKIHIT